MSEVPLYINSVDPSGVNPPDVTPTPATSSDYIFSFTQVTPRVCFQPPHLLDSAIRRKIVSFLAGHPEPLSKGCPGCLMMTNLLERERVCVCERERACV